MAKKQNARQSGPSSKRFLVTRRSAVWLSRLSVHAETASFQPTLIEIEEALVPGFIVEQHRGNRPTVFVPSVPTPMAGAVYIIDNNQVYSLDLPTVAVMQCISKWGDNVVKLVAAYDRLRLPERSAN